MSQTRALARNIGISADANKVPQSLSEINVNITDPLSACPIVAAHWFGLNLEVSQ